MPFLPVLEEIKLQRLVLYFAETHDTITTPRIAIQRQFCLEADTLWALSLKLLATLVGW